MRIIDSHCHYNLDPFVSKWEHYRDEALTAGVIASTVVGTNISTSQLACEMAEKRADLFPLVGIHPGEVISFIGADQSLDETKQVIDNQVNDLESLINRFSVTAIGEIGLDYFWLRKQDQNLAFQKQLQQYLFARQLELAQKHHFPVSIHTRDSESEAYFDVLKILADFPDQRFVLHCVSGSPDYIKQAIERGAWFGVAGNITYPNAQALRELFELLPKDRVMLETDAPFLAPQEFRGKQCEPWMIESTARYLQSQFNLNLDSVLQTTTQFFSLPLQK